jgi:hypothetical protein
LKVKTITLKIECGNDAFQGEGGAAELYTFFERAFPHAAYELYAKGIQKTVTLQLRDSNGNTCATLTVEKEDD